MNSRRTIGPGQSPFAHRAAVHLPALIALVLSVWLPAGAFAAPGNDACSGAVVIPANGPFPYFTPIVDVTTATTNGDPPAPIGCSGSGFPSTAARSVWYRFTPNKGGPFLLATCRDLGAATTLEDSILAVHTSSSGCNGTLTQIADGCNDDACGPSGLQSALAANLRAGVTYYIVAWHFGGPPPLPGEASLQLLVGRLVAPTNDVCSGAVQLQLNQPVFGATLGA